LEVVSWHDTTVFAVALALAGGCAEHLGTLSHSSGWTTGVLFWPPPGATSSWLAEPAAPSTLGEAALRIRDSLRAAGYTDQRWLPIGVHYEHGFAVTTRLERVDDDGTPGPSSERWLSAYPGAVSLRWLDGSATPFLPSRGRYRVLLVAFTDLHIRPPGRPDRWDETTAMEGPDPDMAPPELPTLRVVSGRYRVGFYVYEYEASGGQGDGTFVDHDARVPAKAHLERSGLGALGR
jgi:hypothetical protein